MLKLVSGFRIQQRATQWQREAGLLPPEPEVLTYLTTKAEPVSEPALMATVQGYPEAFMTLNLSRNLDQGMNPAYQLRDGFQTQSCMKSDFIWDQQEVNIAVRCSHQCLSCACACAHHKACILIILPCACAVLSETWVCVCARVLHTSIHACCQGPHRLKVICVSSQGCWLCPCFMCFPMSAFPGCISQMHMTLSGHAIWCMLCRSTS